MDPRSFLFVHSPLVGPSSMQRLAEVAIAEGHRAFVPDLTSITHAESPCSAYTGLAAAAAAEVRSPVVVVGHSGAGAFLPGIGAEIDDVEGLVFVDAVVPPRSGQHRTPDALRAMLDEQTVDGLLHPWLEWWPDDVVRELLPDSGDRVALEADLPQLQRSFYDIDVDVPDGWADRRCAYVQLSQAYEAETAEARSRGWPVEALESTHLGIRTDPGVVLRSIERVIGQGRAS